MQWVWLNVLFLIDKSNRKVMKQKQQVNLLKLKDWQKKGGYDNDWK